MQATAVHMAGVCWPSGGMNRPPRTTLKGRIGMALGRIDAILFVSSTMGSCEPKCLGGIPRRTCISNEWFVDEDMGRRNVLRSMASCNARKAASVASPDEADPAESIPKPMLDIASAIISCCCCCCGAGTGPAEADDVYGRGLGAVGTIPREVVGADSLLCRAGCCCTPCACIWFRAAVAGF